MKKYLLCTLFLFSFSGYSQPSIQWQKAVGGTGVDTFRSTLQTSDGGYIIAGSSTSVDGDISGNHGSSDVIVVKLSPLGSIEWQKSYGGSGNESAESIKKTSDGGYVIVGSSSSLDGDVTGNHGFGDFWIIKIAGDGVLQWQKSLGGTNGDNGRAIQQTPDGGYIVGGSTSSIDGDVTGNHNPPATVGNSDYWVVKLTETGNIVWQKCLGSFSSDYLSSIAMTNDGGYIAVGEVQANDGDVTGHHGDFDYWVVKLSSAGAIECQKALGGSGWDAGRDIIQNSAGNYIVAGYSSSGNGDITGMHGDGDGWVLELDAAGNIIWQKAVGGTGSDFLYSVRQAVDGYILAGDTTSNDEDASGNHGTDSFDYWGIKLSAAGDVQWHKLLGGSGDDSAFSIIALTDGNYLVSGHVGSNDGDVTGSQGVVDGWIAYLANDLAVNESSPANKFTLYPNPAKGVINVSADAGIIGTAYVIYDQLARIVKTGTLDAENSIIQVEDLSNGVYLFSLDGVQAKIVKN